MRDKKRRPPDLTEASLGAVSAPNRDRASTASAGILSNGGTNRSCSAELQRCLRGLHNELDSAIQQYHDELMQVVERWSALQDAGWRSAPSEPASRPFINRSLERRAAALPGVPAEAPKLPPPPQTLTPVNSGGTQVRRAADACQTEKAELVPLTCGGHGSGDSPRTSLSSTRTTVSGSVEISQSTDRGVDRTQEAIESGKIERRPSVCRDGPTPAPFAPVLSLSSKVPVPPACMPPALQPASSASNDTSHLQIAVAPSTYGKGSSEEPKHLESRWVNKSKTFPSHTQYSPLSKRRIQMLTAGRSALAKVTRSYQYELLNALFIVLNALFVVWETDRRAALATRGAAWEEVNKEETYFGIVANIFCVIFVTDVVLRALADRWLFFRSTEKAWNVFDTFVCLTAVMEVIVHWCTYTAPTPSALRMYLRKFSMLRVLRLLRVIYVTRSIRIISIIRELRLMVLSLSASLKSLAWSLVLILIILQVFSVFFTDGVIAYCAHHNAMHSSSTKEMRKYFGSVYAATISLFMSMSGGEDWGIVMSALQPLPSEYTFLFIAFISFTVLALMNVVTAVFVNTALQRSQNDREIAVQQELANKDELVGIVQQVFLELDSNQSGALSLDEFEKHIEDDKIMAYLRSRGIDIGQVRTLFALLDVDQTGDVDMDEFVQGVLRLKGGATSMDLAVLTYQVEWILHNMKYISQRLETLLTGNPKESDDA